MEPSSRNLKVSPTVARSVARSCKSSRRGRQAMLHARTAAVCCGLRLLTDRFPKRVNRSRG